jgi:cellobiose phosphorylase
LNEGEKAVRLLQLMNPIESNRTPADVARYRGGPYVTAGEVYAGAGVEQER